MYQKKKKSLISQSNRRRMAWFLIMTADKLVDTNTFNRVERAYIEHGKRNIPERKFLSNKDVGVNQKNTKVILGNKPFDKGKVAEKHNSLKVFSVLDNKEQSK